MGIDKGENSFMPLMCCTFLLELSFYVLSLEIAYILFSPPEKAT